MGQTYRILLTAFRGSSAEKLIGSFAENPHEDHRADSGIIDTTVWRTLLLPNDKVRDSQILIEHIAKEQFALVMSFGQRPNIKNKVHIETTARDGESKIITRFDCDRLCQVFGQSGLTAKISHNAGTSFCNRLYWNGLNYLAENRPDIKMVFIHIPYLKNITDFNSFGERIFQAFSRIQSMKIV